jgi:hypothetical protein
VRILACPISKYLRLLLVACALIATAPPAYAQLLTQTLSGVDVATALQNALGGTTVHLHNLGPFANGSYHAANASSIKLPARISGAPGQRSTFSLPDATTSVLGRRYAYYIDHVRSNGVFVTAGPDSFTVSVTLASPGPALVGTCVRLKSPPAPCTGFGEASLPAIEWRDARIDIVAKPIVVDRSLALDVQSVTIVGDFDIGKTCAWPVLGTKLCALVNRQSQRLRSQLAQQAKATLNTADLQRAVAAGVRAYLDTSLNAPLLGIRRVAMQNGQLTIGLGFGR